MNRDNYTATVLTILNPIFSRSSLIFPEPDLRLTVYDSELPSERIVTSLFFKIGR